MAGSPYFRPPNYGRGFPAARVPWAAAAVVVYKQGHPRRCVREPYSADVGRNLALSFAAWLSRITRGRGALQHPAAVAFCYAGLINI